MLPVQDGMSEQRKGPERKTLLSELRIQELGDVWGEIGATHWASSELQNQPCNLILCSLLSQQPLPPCVDLFLPQTLPWPTYHLCREEKIGTSGGKEHESEV